MKYNTIIFLGILIFPVLLACEPDDTKEAEIDNIIYNQKLIEKHQEELAQSNYPEETKDLQHALAEAAEIIKEMQLETINIWASIVRPPAPCPGPRTNPHCWPGDPFLRNVRVGIFSHLAAESNMHWVDLESGEIVAKGVFLKYDEKKSVAWFEFKEVKPELVSNALVLQAQTLIKEGQDVLSVKLEEKVPANTFALDK